MNYYMPIVIVVVANTCYHLVAKCTPQNTNPFGSLTITYLVAAACAAIGFFVFTPGNNFIAAIRQTHWTAIALGVAIVGLEVGFLYLYKVGWDISIGQLICSAILSVLLIIIGVLFFKEQLSLSKILGIVICMVGLFFINK